MASGTGTILELRLEADGLGGQISFPPGLRPAPGQYLIASGPDPYETLPVALFPSQLAPSRQAAPNEPFILRIAPPLPVTWSAGMRLALRGPLGNGFRMPVSARRIALASLEGAPMRLLPLAAQALAQHAAVAVYTQAIPPGLPEEVEILPLDLLPEAPAWADFMALDVRRSLLPELRARLGLNPFQRPASAVQVLVVTAMPCSGLAECGACAIAIHGAHGGTAYALACTDGPVFDYNQLEG